MSYNPVGSAGNEFVQLRVKERGTDARIKNLPVWLKEKTKYPSSSRHPHPHMIIPALHAASKKRPFLLHLLAQTLSTR